MPTTTKHDHEHIKPLQQEEAKQHRHLEPPTPSTGQMWMVPWPRTCSLGAICEHLTNRLRMAIPALNSSVISRGLLCRNNNYSTVRLICRLLHSPKEGKPGEVDGEGDDVEQDAQHVHHQAQQHCLLTLMVSCLSQDWEGTRPAARQEPKPRRQERAGSGGAGTAQCTH